MSRATTKEDLILNAINGYENLMNYIATMSENQLETAFDFSKEEKKKEAHWKRDKNLRDVYIHLYEWHQLVLSWVNANLEGDQRAFLPAPYNWKSYGDMNVMFFEKHQATSLAQATELLKTSHQEVLTLVKQFSQDELFIKQKFAWVGGSTLASYFISATSAHYEWALKKLKAHCKLIQP